tara:strand:+ start:2376 stop:3527 length:1152 start_codon:yes stop_codon:yes gene_type:complete
MSHLLEEYAKNLGVKISLPIVNDHFFPLTADKYITLSNDDNVESKHYPYYDIVLHLLQPFLRHKNIKVVQLGGKSKIEGVDAALNLSFKQQSFILSGSLLHVGSDNVLNHLASAKNIPTVNIFGNTFPKINRPIFSRSSFNINLAPVWDKKPCFSHIDPKKQITTIKPEKIAGSILDLLKIKKDSLTFETLHIGEKFKQKIVEVVPTVFNSLNLLQNQVPLIRADYGFEEGAFLKFCESYRVSVYLDKLIQPQALRNIAANIQTLFIFVDAGWDTIPDNYFKILKNLNIEPVLLVKNEKEISAIRNKYFDISVRPYRSEKKPLCPISGSSRFLSEKRIVEGAKEYLSYAHWEKGLDRDNRVLDTPEYWKESDHFYIYEPNENS